MENSKKYGNAVMALAGLAALFLPVGISGSAVQILQRWKAQSMPLALILCAVLIAVTVMVILNCYMEQGRADQISKVTASVLLILMLGLIWLDNGGFALPEVGGLIFVVCMAGIIVNSALGEKERNRDVSVSQTGLQAGYAGKVKQELQPEIRPEPRPEVQPRPKPEVQPRPKPEVQSRPKPEIQSRPKPEVQPRPEIQSGPKPEIRPESRPEVQSRPKPEVQPKTGVRSELQPGRLQIFCGLFDGGEIELKHIETVTIGRDAAQCNLIIEDEAVSRRHCSVTYNAASGKYLLMDISENGTYLDGGQRLPKNFAMEVPEGTRFYVGEERNMFRLGR